jgi:polyhydroxyalkanoate synthesis regulator phasin
MNVKKTLAIAAMAVALGAGSLLAVTNASADEGGSTLIDRLVERFNLDREEVQVVFDEVRSEKRAEHEAKMEERLNQAVEDGKLTEEQKNLLNQKHAENQAFRETLKNMSDDEKKAALKQHHLEMKWPFGPRPF